MTIQIRIIIIITITNKEYKAKQKSICVRMRKGENGTHVSGIMLGRIENGQRRIDDTLLHALCELYHIDSNDLTINACQSHITALQQNKCPANSAETDVNWFLDTYRSLPENRQADIRTMLRLYSYMDKFSNLDS